MKAYEVEYRVPGEYGNKTALVLATTVISAVTKLRMMKHVGGNRIIEVRQKRYEEILK
jgi:hypothetical protein